MNPNPLSMRSRAIVPVGIPDFLQTKPPGNPGGCAIFWMARERGPGGSGPYPGEDEDADAGRTALKRGKCRCFHT
jgi:hypothetical protein